MIITVMADNTGLIMIVPVYDVPALIIKHFVPIEETVLNYPNIELTLRPFAHQLRVMIIYICPTVPKLNQHIEFI